MTTSGGQGARRAVVVGASNVRRGLPSIVAALEQAWGSPLELLLAAGHGRSYGLETRVLGRALPSILDCRLWEILDTRPPLPTLAVMTDIGNDIIYGVPAARLERWVVTCAERLVERCERVVITRLPLETIRRVSPRTLRVLNRILFPFHQVQRDEALRTAEWIDLVVQQLAKDQRVTVVDQQADWYGLDPVHVAMRAYGRAWRVILASCDSAARAPIRLPLAQCLRLRLARPEHYRLFGQPRHQPQPAITLRDQTTVWLY